MRKKNSISRIFLFNSLIATIVSIVLIGSLWTWQQYLSFQRESEDLQEVMLNSYKDLLKTQVQKSVEYIEYSKSLTEKQLRASIRERIHEAHAIASHLYEKWKDQKSTEEIKIAIKESLRAVRFNQSRGYFFILDLYGVNQLQADRPEFEGRNMLEVPDSNETGVVRDMISLVKQRGEGFFRYDWTKPGISEGTFPKIAFVKLFKPYQWIIGTVTARTNSVEALEEFRASIGKFGLIITDMTMPNMTGEKLAHAFKAIRPDIPVILCTGFSEKINEHSREDLRIDGFMMKPIDKAKLARTVRKVLDEAPIIR